MTETLFDHKISINDTYVIHPEMFEFNFNLQNSALNLSGSSFQNRFFETKNTKPKITIKMPFYYNFLNRPVESILFLWNKLNNNIIGSKNPIKARVLDDVVIGNNRIYLSNMIQFKNIDLPFNIMINGLQYIIVNIGQDFLVTSANILNDILLNDEITLVESESTFSITSSQYGKFLNCLVDKFSFEYNESFIYINIEILFNNVNQIDTTVNGNYERISGICDNFISYLEFAKLDKYFGMGSYQDNTLLKNRVLLKSENKNIKFNLEVGNNLQPIFTANSKNFNNRIFPSFFYSEGREIQASADFLNIDLKNQTIPFNTTMQIILSFDNICKIIFNNAVISQPEFKDELDDFSVMSSNISIMTKYDFPELRAGD